MEALLAAWTCSCDSNFLAPNQVRGGGVAGAGKLLRRIATSEYAEVIVMYSFEYPELCGFKQLCVRYERVV